jgi:hypothetical protein
MDFGSLGKYRLVLLPGEDIGVALGGEKMGCLHVVADNNARHAVAFAEIIISGKVYGEASFQYGEEAGFGNRSGQPDSEDLFHACPIMSRDLKPSMLTPLLR